MQPNLVDYARIFAEDERWLVEQFGPGRFEEGCAELAGQMNTWISDYTERVCDTAVTPGAQRHESYLRRVWRCWATHWQDAIAESNDVGRERDDQARLARGHGDARQVAQVLLGETTQQGKAVKGADLILDVVLVESVLLGDGKAIKLFEESHDPRASRLAASFDPSLQTDLAWWQDTKSRLIGTPTKRGDLKGFFGKGSLASFMDTTIKRDLCRTQGKIIKEREKVERLGQRKKLGELNSGCERTPEQLAATRDCHALFRDAWREAFIMSPPADQAAIKLVHGDGMTNVEAAKVLGKHKGTITKTLSRVYTRFREAVFQPNGEFASVYRDCGHDLFDKGNALGLLEDLFKEESSGKGQP